jgi:FG-GAP-like repeat/FG-GAP repeat
MLLMLGNGDGTFGPAKPIDGTKYDAAQLAVGDLNGDGKLDLVVMDHSGQTTGSPVNVVLGNGDGTFQAPQSYAVGDQIQSGTTNFVPQGVALADLNGDGKLDVAVAESGAGTVGSTLTVLLGHGNGTLAAPLLSTQTLPEVPLLSGGDEVEVATADLRGIGRTDLIGGGIDGITVHLRNSDGSYATPVTYGLNGRVAQIATGDLTGDGRPDIVALLPDQNAVAVLINNGDGTFTRGANLIVGHGIGSLLLGDFSGDGKLDLAVTVNGDPDPATGLYPNAGVALALGNGNGTFAAPLLTLAGASPSGTVGHALAAGDLNHDGKLDLVVIATGLASPDFRQGGVFVLLGNGNGTFQAGPTYLTVNDYDQATSNALHYVAPQAVALGDLDGDSTLDMAVSIGPSIFVLAGNGDGTFRHSHPKAHDTLGFAPFGTTGSWNLSVADLNGDGRADIVATNRGAFQASSSFLATMVATRDPFNEHSGTFGTPFFTTRLFGVGRTAQTTIADATASSTSSRRPS